MSQQIHVVLPDGQRREVPPTANLADVAASIGAGLARSALAGKINGKQVDLDTQVTDGDKVALITASSPEGLEILRHSAAHVMAMAVQEVFPGTQITIGPVIENGFFYDVYPPENVKISSDDFERIEKKMTEICNRDIKVNRKVVSREDAIAHFEKLGEKFKVEIVKSLPENEDIKIYEIGQWGDLCRGPHVPSTSKIGAFKLMSIAGAYWRANKDNEQLVRIYATAWATKKDLEAHLHMLEEAKKRDHLLLGKQLDLFSMHPEVAVGAPFFHPHGAKLFTLLQNYIRKKTTNYGFKEIQTPQIMNVDLWKISGHYQSYRENMYFTKIDEKDYAIKPMNCPGHIKVFSGSQRSYRDLPLRFSEFGTVHRHELSGAVHGLTRVRRFTQDDGHIFCMPDQVEGEIRKALQLVNESYSDLGFNEVQYFLSTRPDERIGDDAHWDIAEDALASALKAEKIDYTVNPGDGAFYGPKIDFKIKDAIGRLHQCATLQLDYQMPGRFSASYMSTANTFETPVMIHRAVLGSIDRFMGIFIEHWAGHFPVGLSPVQARIINVNSAQEEYAQKIEQILLAQGVRVETDLSNDKLGFKIRSAQMKKVPYMLVIGAQEQENATVTARFHDGKNLAPMSPEDFIAHIKKESGVFWGLDVNQL